MVKIKKYQLIKILEIAKDCYGLKTIDELIEDINKKVINNDDIAVQIEEYQETPFKAYLRGFFFL